MALSIKIVTTNGISRQFYQSDSALGRALIDRLRNNGNIFSSSSLVISSELQTEIFSPKFIVAIELNSEQGMDLQLPDADNYFQAIDTTNDTFAYDLDHDFDLGAGIDQMAEQESGILRRVRVEFCFVGGHKINTELNISNDDFSTADRINRITQFFEQSVVYYRTASAGLGLLNPYRLTRAIVTPRALELPLDTIVVDDY